MEHKGRMVDGEQPAEVLHSNASQLPYETAPLFAQALENKKQTLKQV